MEALYFSLSTLFRYEYRSLFYSDKSTTHQSRFRVHVETKTALNNISFTDDDAYYMFADVEQYFDFDDVKYGTTTAIDAAYVKNVCKKNLSLK